MLMTYCVSFLAICAIAAIVIIGMINGHDGILAGSGMTVIGGIAGYTVGKKRA